MIRSKLMPGLRVTWRGQGKSSETVGTGILFEKLAGRTKIYVERFVDKFSVQTNLGLKVFRDIDILILDREDVLLDELLTSDNKHLREFAHRLAVRELNKGD